MKTKILFLLMLSIAFSGTVMSQKASKVTITGTVTGSDSKPITSAIIMIDGVNTS